MSTYFTLLPWDKIQIVQQVPKDYFDEVLCRECKVWVTNEEYFYGHDCEVA